MKKITLFLFSIFVVSIFAWDYYSFTNNNGPSSSLFNPASLTFCGRSGTELFFQNNYGELSGGFLMGDEDMSLGIQYFDDKKWVFHSGMGMEFGKIGLGFSYHYDISKTSKFWWASGGALLSMPHFMVGSTVKWGDYRYWITSLSVIPLKSEILTLSCDFRLDIRDWDGSTVKDRYDWFIGGKVRPIEQVGIFSNFHYINSDRWELRAGLSFYTGSNFIVGDYLDENNYRLNIEKAIEKKRVKLPFQKNRIIKIDIEGEYSYKYEKRSGLEKYLPFQIKKSFLDIILKLNDTVKDKKTSGFYIVLGNNNLSASQIYELRSILERYKKINSKGKIVTYLPKGASLKDYYLASVSDEIIMEKAALLYFKGISSEIFFFKGLFDKLGIKGEFIRPDDCIYKSAIEQFTMEGPSEEMRTNFKEVMGDYYTKVVKEIKSSRGIDIDTITKDNLFISADKALELKIIDKIDHIIKPEKYFGKKLGILPLNSYLKESCWRCSSKIGIVSFDGMIANSGSSGGFGSEKTINPDMYKKLAEKIKRSKIKDFILLIRSPGGSGSASDLIYEITDQLKKDGKNIYVYMYDVAGSGGYYISANATKIFASPYVITGSIGVLGGKISLQGLYEKIGINSETIGVGNNNEFFSSGKDFSKDDKDKFKSYLTEFYNLFIQRVADGRGLESDYVKQMAKGKIYSGEKAREIKLVDETGTLFDLINYIKKENNWKGDVSFKRFYTSRFEFLPLKFRLKTIADIIGNNSYKPLAIM